jgi:hypothetical protein
MGGSRYCDPPSQLKCTISLKFYNPNIFFQGLGLQLEGQLDYNFRQGRKCVFVTF